MLKINSNNEKIKRQYEKFLKHHRRYSEKTIDKNMLSINLFEEFFNYEDFSKINDETGVKYVEHLKNRKKSSNGEIIKLSTVKSHLIYLRNFFHWLAMQPGFKRKIKIDYIYYFYLSKKEETMAKPSKRTDYPSFETIIDVIAKIPDDEIGKRDKALMSFALLSAGRNAAIASLPIECFNINDLMVDFNAQKGVLVKNSKSYLTFLFRFGDKLIEYVKIWYNYLLEVKHYSPKDPLFPKTAMGHKPNSKSYTAIGVKPEFWKSDADIENVFEKRFIEAGYKYYCPHTFRHVAEQLAIKKCTSVEQLKAVSQNFGHEKIDTSFSCYGVLPPEKQKEIIKNMDFSNKPVLKSIDEITNNELFLILQRRLNTDLN